MKLFVSRRIGERIIIGEGPDAIVIEINRIAHGKVRVGVSAPPKVPVHRKEIYDLIHANDTKPEDRFGEESV